jgi:hypothetical protein
VSTEVAGDKLQDLIAYIASSLVDDPDSVEVNVIEEDRALVLELSVAPDDLGKVIGKEGRTARAMRTLLAATSARLRKRAILDILE